MAEVRVDIHDIVPEFVDVLRQVEGKQVFPNILAAMSEIAALYREAWMGFASGVPIPGSPRVINSRAGGYRDSIKLDLSKDNEKVVYTDSPVHRYIEDGSPEVDLKPGLLSGPKARQGKDGPYNIVAFRHGTPGTLQSNRPMPVNVYNIVRQQIRQAQKSRTDAVQTSQQQRQKARPPGRMQVIAATNQQGRRSKLVGTFSEGRGSSYTWKSGQFAGMQRITGVARSTQYITFRVVSFRSPPSSWIVPPREGVPIREAVVSEVRDLAEEMLKEALRRDLE